MHWHRTSGIPLTDHYFGLLLTKWDAVLVNTHLPEAPLKLFVCNSVAHAP